jgi:hypothetical protein
MAREESASGEFRTGPCAAGYRVLIGKGLLVAGDVCPERCDPTDRSRPTSRVRPHPCEGPLSADFFNDNWGELLGWACGLENTDRACWKARSRLCARLPSR